VVVCSSDRTDGVAVPVNKHSVEQIIAKLREVEKLTA
jgi:hypothetical protein